MMPCWSSSLIAPVALRRDAAMLTNSSKKRRLSASLPRFGMKATLRPSLVRYYHTTRENPSDSRVAALERLRTFRCERSNIANRRKPAVVEAETADPSVASRAQKEAQEAVVGKAPVLEPYLTLKLNCAKPRSRRS